MPIHTNSLENLNGKKFVTGDNRTRPGRPKGSRNRKTLFKEWMTVETDCVDPNGNTVQLPMADKIALAAINQAAKGNTAAINIVLDNTYGKLKDEPEKPEQPPFNWSAYTEEEIQQLMTLLAKGTDDGVVEFEE